MYKDLDPLLHSQLRLAIISLVVSEGKVDFKRIKEVTQATGGNISVQIKKLQEAKYMEMEKTFVNNYPNTSIKITTQGLFAFEKYIEALKGYINP
ncbi:MAG: transcriptional regulator [Saprospiraceae bacterium]|nr:transcriptional regulator [Saprospiraceae bacterium]|tara:strand:+ start:473 stop:757 length:285 start_codon:yes stop_codon:yes gene_type:complete